MSISHLISHQALIAVMTGLCIVCAASVFCAGANKFAVIPGHSLGQVELGSSRVAVHKILGLSYLDRSNQKLKTEYFHVNRSDKDHYLSVIYKQDKVIQIETDAPQFMTAQGISADSTLGEIRGKLGNLHIVSFGQDDPDPDLAEHAQHFYDDVRHGLAFELDLGNRANTSAEVVPAGLIVHPAGQAVIAPE